jgi:hypothetical protein
MWLCLTVVLLTVLACPAKNVSGKSYTFTLPQGVTCDVQNKPENYTFRWERDETYVLFKLTPHPVAIREEDIQLLVDLMGVEFENEMNKMPEVKQVRKSNRRLEAGPFKGPELEFIVETRQGKEERQYLFMLWDGERLLNGRLTKCNLDDLKKAHAILEKASKKPAPKSK